MTLNWVISTVLSGNLNNNKRHLEVAKLSHSLFVDSVSLASNSVLSVDKLELFTTNSQLTVLEF